MATPTTNPIPSSNLLDGKFNFEKLDELVNSPGSYFTDRFGLPRLTIKGMEANIDAVGKGFTIGLNQADGLKYLGGVDSFETLRTIKPTEEGQRILLKSWGKDTGLGGGVFIGHLTAGTDDGGTIAAGDGYYWERADVNVLSPEMFGAAKSYDQSVDDVTYVQRAIDTSITNGIKTVVLSRFYSILSAPQVFAAPGDDGSVYPSWVTAGSDDNISPEPSFKIKCSLLVSTGVSLIGINKSGCGFVGNWSPSSSEIGLESGCGILFSNGGKSQTVTNSLVNLTFKNFFIGGITEGIAFNTAWDNLVFSYCGIASIQQGKENCISANISLNNCYAGIISGGWWTYRSRVQSANAAIPPYPAKDVFLSGWNDADDIFNLDFSVFDPVWGERHQSIDNFFDTYFYKDTNSILTSNGGRASNSDLGYNQAIFTPFRGICSRAVAYLNRYGRNISNCSIKKVKTYGAHRAPIYAAETNNCTASNLFIERGGWVNASQKTGSFGVDTQDPWRSPGYLQPTVAEGFIVSDDLSIPNTVVGNRPPVLGGYSHRVPSPSMDSASDKAGAQSYLKKLIYNNAGQKYEPLMEVVTMVGDQMIEPRNLYVKNIYYQQIPALLTCRTLPSNNVLFEYYEGVFAPTLNVGGSGVSLASNKGVFLRSGSQVTCWIDIFINSIDLSTLTGIVTIGGFPFSLSSLDSASAFPLINVGVIPSGAVGITGAMNGDILTMRKNNGRENLLGTDFISASTYQIRLGVTFTIGRTLAS